jgi:dipeptidyl aminopeptidase/acylaminoacyl peptidase
MRATTVAVLSLALAATAGGLRPEPVAPAAAVVPDVPSGAAAARDAELAKQAAGVVDVFQNWSAVFSPDGTAIAFISNRDGLPQLYLAAAAQPAAAPRRLITSTERVGQARFTPDGKSVLFTSDHGADENWSIFRFDLAAGRAVELTPGEELNRDFPFVPAGAPGVMYYSARRMDAPASALYAQPVAAGAAGAAGKPGKEPRRLYGEPGLGYLAGVSRDGKRAAWVRVPSATENYLEIVDLASGTARAIYPATSASAASAGSPAAATMAASPASPPSPPSPANAASPASAGVRIEDAALSPDGRRVYVATDAGGEQALVLALDAETGREQARYTEAHPATAGLGPIVLGKRGDVMALGLLAGNRSEIRLLDAATLRPAAKVELPLGRGTPTALSDDGRHLAVTWSTPSAPDDVFDVDAGTGKVAPLRRDQRPGLSGLPNLEVSVAEVSAFDGLKLPVNVYLPAQAAGKRLPVIVSYHGGPAGTSVIGWSSLARFFTSLGYAWVEPNVRGSDGFGRAFEMADNGPRRLDAFKDVETTGRWAAAQAWADSGRVVVFGGSYGGYTVLIGLTRMPSLWRAGVDLFGVANLRTFLKSTSGEIREVFKLEFGDLDKDGPFLDSISPVRDAAKIVAPLFVYAGANDPRVPRPESDQIVAALRERGVPVEYMVAGNEGHSLSHRENRIELFARSARFLERQLGR